MNFTVNFSSTYGLPKYDIAFAISVVTLLLVPPLNIYTLLLIVRGGVETIKSDFYRLNLAVSEILMCFYCLFYILYVLQDISVLILGVMFFVNFLHVSRHLFLGCICVECYLAVVHPVIFLRYKLLRYKIMCCSVVWFITLAFCVFYTSYGSYALIITHNALLGFYTVVFSLMLFCCVSVLWALKQPGPGDGRRVEGYGAKRRAFNIIMTTTVITVMNYLPMVPLFLLSNYISPQVEDVALAIVHCCGLLPALHYLQSRETFAVKFPGNNEMYHK